MSGAKFEKAVIFKGPCTLDEVLAEVVAAGEIGLL